MSGREKLALELPERMTYTGNRVTDRFFKRLKKFTEEEWVELSANIAYENFRSNFNPVFGIEANGLCHLPAVQSMAEDAAKSSTKDKAFLCRMAMRRLFVIDRLNLATRLVT